MSCQQDKLAALSRLSMARKSRLPVTYLIYAKFADLRPALDCPPRSPMARLFPVVPL